MANTAEIGLFKILSEGAVAAGIRRIEAVTAERAQAFVDSEIAELNTIRGLFKSPVHVAKSVASLQEENKALKKEIEKLLANLDETAKKEKKPPKSSRRTRP